MNAPMDSADQLKMQGGVVLRAAGIGTTKVNGSAPVSNYADHKSSLRVRQVHTHLCGVVLWSLLLVSLVSSARGWTGEEEEPVHLLCSTWISRGVHGGDASWPKSSLLLCWVRIFVPNGADSPVEIQDTLLVLLVSRRGRLGSTGSTDRSKLTTQRDPLVRSSLVRWRHHEQESFVLRESVNLESRVEMPIATLW
ncbi:hypothetical protein GW17_00048739 [Ensete ventricosum]|nr:hypothetical protein GW17_00048739 [Ensete ventricosum]